VVVQRAQAVASTLNGFDQRLGDVRQQTSLRLTDSIAQLNGWAEQIAQLNRQIVSAEVSGNQAPDLRDQRDLLVDRLAQLGEVRVFEAPNGSAQVLLGNNLVVDGAVAQRFRVATDTGLRTEIALEGDPARPLQSLGGALAQTLDVLNSGLRDTQDRIDALANALARAVNAVHAAGVDATGAPAGPLFVDRTTDTFDAAGDAFRANGPLGGTVTARTIGVRLAVQRDPRLLAATSGAARPADNDVALAMAALRDGATVTVGNATPPVTVRVELILRGQSAAAPTRGIALGEHYRSAASVLGTQVRDATSEAAVRQTLADQAEARRTATSGVNLDEELTTMMRAQQAYAAAAKVVSAADEMMQVLVAMV
jgi:flagellar hook-associated protein 1 FlgK